MWHLQKLKLESNTIQTDTFTKNLIRKFLGIVVRMRAQNKN